MSTLWTAGNGAAWRELTAGSGRWVTADIGVGPLGMVATTSELDPSGGPRPVLVSDDGVTWEQVVGIALLDTDQVTRSWVGPPIVDGDRVALVGSATRAQPVPHLETDQISVEYQCLFIVVGRLVDE